MADRGRHRWGHAGGTDDEGRGREYRGGERRGGGGDRESRGGTTARQTGEANQFVPGTCFVRK